MTTIASCPYCGAQVEGALAGCQAAWDELTFRAYDQPDFACLHDLAFDAYCMQHPEQYGRSAKSYAAHLTRLCCGLEHSGDPAVYAAIRRWLDGRVHLNKPGLLERRGRITVLDVLAVGKPDEYRRQVRAWAEDVWGAYESQYDLARNWLRDALGKEYS